MYKPVLCLQFFSYGALYLKMATFEEVRDIPNYPDKYLIDVRDPEELQRTGIIPASINIPLSKLEQSLMLCDDDFERMFERKKPANNSTIIFSCQSGGRAQRATNIAQAHGYKNAKTFNGSWSEWSQRQQH